MRIEACSRLCPREKRKRADPSVGPPVRDLQRCKTSWLGLAQRLGDLSGEVVLLLLDALAHFDASDSADGQAGTGLLARLGDDVLNLQLVVLHPQLIHQAVVLEELLDLAGDDLVPHVLGLGDLLALDDLRERHLLQLPLISTITRSASSER